MKLTRCQACLLPTTRPDTAFRGGICSACHAYAARAEIDWAAREQDLIRVLESAHHNGSSYDCVIPSSSGKDSFSQVLKVIGLGARPLVVTATTCMLTPIAAENIRILARYATTIEVTPNLRVRAVLNRLGLELVGDLSFAEHVSINCTPFKVAAAFGIPLLVYGECPNREYGGPPGTENTMRMTRRWISEFGGQLRMRPADLIGQEGITAADMADYTLPSDEQMDKINAVFLGQHFPWNSRENARVAVAAGMKVPSRPPCTANWFCEENIDNVQTGLHDFFGYLKYGLGRGCAQLSIDIRYGLISREEAYEKLREIEGLFPFEYMDVSYKKVLDILELTGDSFRKIIRQHMNRALFAEIDEENYRFVLHEFA